MKKRLWIGCIMVLLCTMALGMTTFAAGEKTMTNKKWVSGKGGIYYDSNNNGEIDDFKYNKQYYKIQVPKQGYIIIGMKLSSLPGKQEYIESYVDWDEEDEELVEENLYIEFLNAKKKNLRNFSTDDGDKKFSYAVKKGTYYLAVEGPAAYKLRYTFTPVAKVSKAGKNFAKAVTIKKGATVKNLLTDKKFENYYKLKLNKKTKVVLACDSKVMGGSYEGLGVQIWTKKGKDYRQVNKKGKLISKNESYWDDIQGKATITYTLPKGTYYLRAFSLGSGYYTIKWK